MNEFERLDASTFIAGWIINPELCTDIVKASEANPSLFKQGIREYTYTSLGDLSSSLFDRYCNTLFEVVGNYRSKYELCWKDLEAWGITQPIVQRYEPGKWYSTPHCENDGYKENLLRHLAFMTYLNNIDEGGGTEFIHQGITTPALQGLTVIWPATWTHYHKGVVAPNDTKYIITGWCTFANSSS